MACLWAWGPLLIPGGNDTLLLIGFPDGRMAGCARLCAICCDPCRAHRQIRFDGTILVMTAAHRPQAYCTHAPASLDRSHQSR